MCQDVRNICDAVNVSSSSFFDCLRTFPERLLDLSTVVCLGWARKRLCLSSACPEPWQSYPVLSYRLPARRPSAAANVSRRFAIGPACTHCRQSLKATLHRCASTTHSKERITSAPQIKLCMVSSSPSQLHPAAPYLLWKNRRCCS